MKRIVTALNQLEEYTLSLTLVLLAVGATAQAFFRYVFGISFSWFEEVGRYVGIFVAFLGSSLGVKYGVHFCMDLLVTRMPRRPAAAVKIFVNLVCACFFGMVMYYSWRLTVRTYGFGTTAAATQAPMFIVYLPMPVFSLVMVWRYFVRIFGELKILTGTVRVAP